MDPKEDWLQRRGPQLRHCRSCKAALQPGRRKGYLPDKGHHQAANECQGNYVDQDLEIRLKLHGSWAF